MNSHELNLRLLDRAQEVCEYLIPDGKRQRNEYVSGSVEGGKGDSFGVCLSGDKAGFWNDLNPSAEASGKSLVGLWHRVRGNENFPDTVSEICDWLGIQNKSMEGHVKREAEKVFTPPSKKKIRGFKEGSKAHNYLTNERMISPRVIEATKVCETSDGEAIAFPHFDADMNFCYCNNLVVDRGANEEKKMFAQPGGKLVLFGKHTVPDSADYLIICEGQIDQMSWLQMGFPCVSVPNGAGNTDWVGNDWEWLERFARIYIAFDRDSAGDSGFDKAIRRLGMDRCWRIEYPEGMKDANDMVKAACELSEFQELMENATEVELPEIQRSEAYEKDVWEIFYGSEKDEPGIPYPLNFPSKIPTTYGSIVLLSGFSKHGKTAWTWQIASWLMSHGKSGLIGSFEIPPKQACSSILKSGCAGIPPIEKYESIYKSEMSKIFIYNKVGRVGWKTFLEAARFAWKKYGIFFVVIDSLMRVGIRERDEVEVTEFMVALADFVNETGVKVFLVAHSKKPVDKGGNETKVPTPDMVRGAGQISDNVWAQFTVWRNFKKEELMESGKADAAGQEDGIIELQKQRFFDGRTRKMKLNFSPDAGQYYEVGIGPKRYFEF